MEHTQPVFLSIVITQYNEKKNLERGVLDDVRTFLEKQPYTWEVVINDDGSTDGSDTFVADYVTRHPQFTLIKGNHGGKAAGLLNGIQHARGTFVCTPDMDMSTPVSEVTKMLPFFDRGYDIVIGSRGTERENFSLLRKTASTSFRIFRKIFLLRDINDTQCGFKMYRTDLAKELFPRLDAVSMKIEGWTVTAFDVELLFMAQKRGHKIKEVPVQWEDEDVSDTKNRGGKFVKESLDMAKQILQVRINWLRGKYRA